jgi:hypothetical protein
MKVHGNSRKNKKEHHLLEDKHIDAYREKYGRNPRGNSNKTKKQRGK